MKHLKISLPGSGMDYNHKIKLTPDMVSQSSTYVNPDPNHSTHGPEMAIDGDEGTVAHTKCELGSSVWYKINFGKTFYVSEVKFINHFSDFQYDHPKMRMDGTRVLVTNNEVEKEELCETLHVPADDNRQIYSINCGDKIGDGIILRGKEGKSDACIHIDEIEVSGGIYPGNFDDNELW